jgi:hypothetical protein
MNLTSTRLILLGFILGVVASSAGGVYAQRSPAPDALIASPDHYKLEFENAFVRVIRGKFGPRNQEVMHSHPEPGGVLINLTDQNVRQTSVDGTTREIHYKAGETHWSPAGTHRGENLDDKVMEFIRVEVKESHR